MPNKCPSGDEQHFAHHIHGFWVCESAKKARLPLSVAVNIHVVSPQQNFEDHYSFYYSTLHNNTGIFFFLIHTILVINVVSKVGIKSE